MVEEDEMEGRNRIGGLAAVVLLGLSCTLLHLAAFPHEIEMSEPGPDLLIE